MTSILIHEVGPRDGLQAESAVVPREIKLDWIRRVADSGVDIVQVGSFVRGDKMPQMADTDDLFRILSKETHRALLSGLVLNEKGLERALEVGVQLICMGVSASDTHSRKNTGMSTEDATRRIIATALEAKKAGRKVQVSVQSAFGCGFEGAIDEARVMSIVSTYLDAGLRSISLADTAGHAHPAQVRRYVQEVLELDPAAEVTAHIHDTYGLGMASVYAAMEAGARAIETSFGGLGGCPFTKVAAGNVATEDLVHGLQRTGQRLDIDLAALIGVSKDVARHFGRELPGCVYKTGPIQSKAMA
ncbi:hydroxymethylglutaryl-CoA lyase [Geothrix limicola]|uniref:Hydroxymethylglutaryl-CoA lyase n=1 Tax=Geothrix limicola TaxID=2927978 RepID=A0ABQ5QJE5_9BACT|nr:hydroxymethylglutaryl-CoA lyase [Geothrix limicola]GLH74689.1 hydroxymethylglutaryl-CoA lyase [Geothrix limicola]